MPRVAFNSSATFENPIPTISRQSLARGAFIFELDNHFDFIPSYIHRATSPNSFRKCKCPSETTGHRIQQA